MSHASREVPSPKTPSTNRVPAWIWTTLALALLIGLTILPGAPRMLARGADAPQFPRDPVQRQIPSSGMWTDVSPQTLGPSAVAPRIAGPFRTLALNRGQLDSVLALAPREFTLAALNTSVELDLPWPDGGLRRFRIEDSPIMEPALAAQHPEIRTYRGQGLTDATASVRMDVTPFGFHAMVLSSDGTVYIDPYAAGDVTHYLAYYRRDVQRGDDSQFSCGVTSSGDELRYRRDGDIFNQPAHGTQLRTYRAAVAATVEYTAFYGGTVGGALAGMTTTMNRVNGIYERDLAVRMNLVANNNLIVYAAEPDPYSNNSGSTMLGQNQANLDAVIGSANYDIGHVFSTGGGGVAFLQSVCSAATKARGVTGLPSPTGDVFAVDYVAHEMGHQFGGNHTFNGTTSACGGGNRSAANAYEPGSGSTIQAYAGICGAENLQSNSDAYFHARSQDEMILFITAGGGSVCPVVTATANTPPTVNAGADYTIPQSTPFMLTATGSDANGDSLTYAWEQYNVGAAAPPNTDDGTRPIFRSFNPVASPSRTFPRLANILSNTLTIGEAWPTTTRTMTFRVTVRDNRSGGGGTASDDMLLNVRADAGPFVITSPNTAVTYAGNSAQTVTWNVANTTAAPVSTADVKISLSTDGGNTFPTVILASTPNDGSQVVTIPNIATSTARLKVEAVGNVYFDINDANFTITAATGTTITASPAVLSFGATKNGAAGSIVSVTPPQQVTVGFTGLVPTWTVASDQPWAVVTGGAGTGAGQFTVSIANPGNVIGGSTALAATITISSGTSLPVNVTVNLAVQQTVGASAVPFGQVDTPAQGAGGLVGAIGVTGWALDDVGVSTVSVYRPCLAFDNPASCQMIQGTNLVFVGTGAFLAGARPDVEAAFPTLPQSYRGGWGFQILTNMLPHIPNSVLFGGQGTFPLYAFATDIEGNVTLLGRSSTDHTPTTVTVTNDAIAKPFGTIDTPLLGATVSGVVANFGWVLTPDSNTVPDGTDILMPLNGSTMTVYIDGAATAPVAYNQCRGTVGNPVPGGVFCNDDIANIFGRLVPAPTLTPRSDNPTRYRNLDAARGAIGAYNLNTLALTNGLHTIAWGVSDSAGRGEGIGSRFFTVLNGGVAPPPSASARQGPLTPAASARPGAAGRLADLLDAPAQSRGAASTLDGVRRSGRLVAAREGFNPATPMQEIARRADGVRTIALPSSGRAEIAFAAPVSGGYLVANGQLRDLPVGSRLDARTGVFTWNPPPQYLGTYRLVFLIGGERVDVDVTVK